MGTQHTATAASAPRAWARILWLAPVYPRGAFLEEDFEHLEQFLTRLPRSCDAIHIRGLCKRARRHSSHGSLGRVGAAPASTSINHSQDTLVSDASSLENRVSDASAQDTLVRGTS